MGLYTGSGGAKFEKQDYKSGLILNADKTEILKLENNVEKVYELEYIDSSLSVPV